jgi:gluconokinase
LNCILAVDIGTTSTKSLLVQSNGEVVVSANTAYMTDYPQTGYAEQNAETLLSAVKKVIQDVAKENTKYIQGVSFSCAMHSLIAVDEKGKALSPVILWGDTRSARQAQQLRSSKVGEHIYHATGTPIHPMSPLCKLMWMKETQAVLFKNTARFVSIKEYILFHLTGEWAIDYSLASATGLFDVHQLQWMPEALKQAGINESKLSRCVSPYHIILLSNPIIANELYLNNNTPFVLGGSDGCLANLGSGVMEPGELSITIGTSGAARLSSKNFCEDSQQRIFNYRLDEDYFITGGATNNGSVLLKWFSDQILKEKVSPADLLDRAMKVEAGAEGLLFLPYILGERAPFYNPDARGVFFGMAHHHTCEHMLRALIEGICFEIKTIADAIEQCAGEAIHQVVASGGFSHSESWVQLLADILGKQISVNDPNDASAMGAAIIGFNALKIEMSFKSSLTAKLFYPDSEKRVRYHGHFKLFVELTALLQTSFNKITALQKSESR